MCTATATHSGDPESSHCRWLCLAGELAGLPKELAHPLMEVPEQQTAITSTQQALQKPPPVSLAPLPLVTANGLTFLNMKGPSWN